MGIALLPQELAYGGEHRRVGGDGALGQGAGQQIRLEDDLLLRLDELADTAQQLNALAHGGVHGGLVVGGDGDEGNGVLHGKTSIRVRGRRSAARGA